MLTRTSVFDRVILRLPNNYGVHTFKSKQSCICFPTSKQCDDMIRAQAPVRTLTNVICCLSFHHNIIGVRPAKQSTLDVFWLWRRRFWSIRQVCEYSPKHFKWRARPYIRCTALGIMGLLIVGRKTRMCEYYKNTRA